MTPLLATRGGATAKTFGFGASAVAGSFYSIASITATTNNASTFTFDNISQDYTHLQLRGMLKDGRNDSSAGNPTLVRFNNDTTAERHKFSYQISDTANIYIAASYDTAFNLYSNTTLSTNSNTSLFGIMIIDILNYTNTNKWKTAQSMGGYANNSSNSAMAHGQGTYASTSAVSRIDIITSTGNWQTNSTMALYGIKG